MSLKPLIVFISYSRYLAIFLIQPEGLGRLDIYQITEYKDVELIHIDMHTLNEEELR